MKAVSTRGRAPAVSIRQALFAGLAPDGGLYMPETQPRLAAAEWSRLRGAPLAETALRLLDPFLAGELAESDLRSALSHALDFPIPVVRLTDDLHVLELHHGPTAAFKDVGARVLARLLAAFHADERTLTVLVATSGDTGGAVAHAFHGVPRTRVVVLYPRGHVSAVQEAQFTTLGGNVTAVAVAGTFDDCQRLAKAAFADRELCERHGLVSANSISLGRLLPQVTYHVHAALAAGPGAAVAPSVGRFGDGGAAAFGELRSIGLQTGPHCFASLLHVHAELLEVFCARRALALSTSADTFPGSATSAADKSASAAAHFLSIAEARARSTRYSASPGIKVSAAVNDAVASSGWPASSHAFPA